MHDVDASLLSWLATVYCAQLACLAMYVICNFKNRGIFDLTQVQ